MKVYSVRWHNKASRIRITFLHDFRKIRNFCGHLPHFPELNLKSGIRIKFTSKVLQLMTRWSTLSSSDYTYDRAELSGTPLGRNSCKNTPFTVYERRNSVFVTDGSYARTESFTSHGSWFMLIRLFMIRTFEETPTFEESGQWSEKRIHRFIE